MDNEKEVKQLIEELETQLSNQIYTAALVYERAEGAGIIQGNGHHMAQELAREAVKRFRERLIQQ